MMMSTWGCVIILSIELFVLWLARSCNKLSTKQMGQRTKLGSTSSFLAITVW